MLLRQAKNEGIVTYLSNLYDTFFEGGKDHRVDKPSVLHLPYFEGALCLLVQSTAPSPLRPPLPLSLMGMVGSRVDLCGHAAAARGLYEVCVLCQSLRDMTLGLIFNCSAALHSCIGLCMGAWPLLCVWEPLMTRLVWVL